jgi:hypothetical protein
LIAPYFDRPIDVVRSLVAVQAQDYTAGVWAIAQRCNGTRVDVEAALADRSLVRTWPMRGTLHVVSAADARWMLRLLAPRIVQRAAGRYRGLGLDAKTFDKAQRLFEKHLAGDKSMTRAELFAILSAAKIEPKEQRGIHILGKLAMEGVLCFAAHRGKQPTFALLDEWVSKSRTLDGDEALAELAQRYFEGHGPATIDDFVWWTGLPVREARRAHELAKRNLESTGAHWHGALRVAKTARVYMHLLSPWDEYTVGYRDRRPVVDAKHVTATLNGLAPVVLLDGKVAGTWKRAGGEVTVAALAKLPARALDAAKSRYRSAMS